MTLKIDNIQIGQNATPTQNFVLKQGADGTLTLARGNVGATTQDVLTVDASGLIAMPSGSKNLTLATAQATTSGTAIDFTGIPSWVKRISIMLNGVSTNGTSQIRIQLGTSGGVETTGYSINSSFFSTSSMGTASYTAGIEYFNSVAATNLRSGTTVLTYEGSNKWSVLGGFACTESTLNVDVRGTKTLAGTLDRIRLTTANGTDTFDAGSVNIMYEG